VRTSPIVGAALLALAGLAGCGDDAGGDQDGSTNADLEGVQIERVGEYDHLVADLDYDRPAPSGGDHLPAPAWLNCGVYEGEVPDELVVHSLEHGAVWIALGPASTEADRAAAIDLVAGHEGRVVVSDVPDLGNPVELVAWGVRLPLDRADDPRAAAFLDTYVDAQGAPEAGAPCSDAFGDPPTPPPLPLG
jgi:hypothetical protein